MKTIIAAFALTFALAVYAYLPPVEERCGVKVEIGSFPQKIERTGKNSFDWPLGVTEVQAGAPRPVRKAAQPRLASGAFSLEAGFRRTTSIEVNGKVLSVPEEGAPQEWGGSMSKGRPNVDGVSKSGFNTHPPYKKGAGFIWSDFPLELPAVTPIAFTCSNYLVSNHDQPPSDGAEYKVFVLEEGREPQPPEGHRQQGRPMVC